MLVLPMLYSLSGIDDNVIREGQQTLPSIPMLITNSTTSIKRRYTEVMAKFDMVMLPIMISVLNPSLSLEGKQFTIHILFIRSFPWVPGESKWRKYCTEVTSILACHFIGCLGDKCCADMWLLHYNGAGDLVCGCLISNYNASKNCTRRDFWQLFPTTWLPKSTMAIKSKLVL